MNVNTNRSIIKITHSNANINSCIKVIPVNEFTKKYNKELQIKFMKPTENQFDILQFMDDSTSNYKFSEKPIFLQQIINKKVNKINDQPEFGVGSSFKRSQKSSKVEKDVPTTYTMTIDRGINQKKFKTVAQGLNSNSQYLVLVRKSDSLFEAYPIANWYKMAPFSKLDIGSIEESERENLKKDQISDMTSKKLFDKYKVEETENTRNDIVIKEDHNDFSDSELQEIDVLKRRKKDAVFQRVRHGKGNTHEGESDLDDHQGDEVDYMSDSSCDEDVLSEEEKEKIYDAVDVNQETVLRNEIEDLSDQSDQEEEKKEEKMENEVNEDDDDDDDDDIDDDEDSDDTDSDDENRKKAKIEHNSNLVAASLKRANSDNADLQMDGKKFKYGNSKFQEMMEEMKKHLSRKPLSAKDLFKILLKKNLLENSTESKNLFMDCLNRLQPKMESVQSIKLYSL